MSEISAHHARELVRERHNDASHRPPLPKLKPEDKDHWRFSFRWTAYEHDGYVDPIRFAEKNAATDDLIRKAHELGLPKPTREMWLKFYHDHATNYTKLSDEQYWKVRTSFSSDDPSDDPSKDLKHFLSKKIL